MSPSLNSQKMICFLEATQPADPNNPKELKMLYSNDFAAMGIAEPDFKLEGKMGEGSEFEDKTLTSKAFS